MVGYKPQTTAPLGGGSALQNCATIALNIEDGQLATSRLSLRPAANKWHLRPFYDHLHVKKSRGD